MAIDPTSTEAAVRAIVLSLFGEDFPIRGDRLPVLESNRASIYDILTWVLPSLTPTDEFWWRKLGAPFSSMLQTAKFPFSSQCRFLCFVYARIINMMGPANSSGVASVMTIDGSPVELSWVIPPTGTTKDRANREVRFAIEPRDPHSGMPLRGSAVLDYLVSPNGSLGIVLCDEDNMSWRRTTEDFLFPDYEKNEIPEGSRFFVGFDFNPAGTLSLKAYYLPAPSPTPSLIQVASEGTSRSPINLWDVDYTPLRRLVSQLDSGLVKPLELLLSYFECLDDDYKPRIQILALDCVRSSKNRLKLYCRPKVGTSWSDAKRSLTLGGRLNSPEMQVAISHMECLWNNLFPNSASSVDRDLDIPCLDEAIIPDSEENGIKLSRAQHPIGGLLYYYSLVAGKDTVFPKVYLPVNYYCKNDLCITQAVERFYNQKNIGILGPRNGHSGLGWVSREVEEAFVHRPLHDRTGIHTYVTFALKSGGWELTSYFSPEVWLQQD